MSSLNIKTALLSCFEKKPLLPLVQYLESISVKIYATDKTHDFLKNNHINCTKVEELTNYPSILGGRVKTLHPVIMGGILARRDEKEDIDDMHQYSIPAIDLIVVNLYPFRETALQAKDIQTCIEKIDIGGVSLIRAAAKNYPYTTVLAEGTQYEHFIGEMRKGHGALSIDQRKKYAAEAFHNITKYDAHIAYYFDEEYPVMPLSYKNLSLRYGENPHQKATYHGNLTKLFKQIHGKPLSYNNLLDIDAALRILYDINHEEVFSSYAFGGIIKHSNICGAALHTDVLAAWKTALSGDQMSAMGGIFFSNRIVDKKSAEVITKRFFEIIIAPGFSKDALLALEQKKQRIILQYDPLSKLIQTQHYQTVLGGVLQQDQNKESEIAWEEVGARSANEEQKKDLKLANLLCKHLKSNAITIVKNLALIGKGAGQTSRIDAVHQAFKKASEGNHQTAGSVLASDAFFPFDDCVKIAHKANVECFIQPGGSIRDADSIDYCKSKSLVMVLTRTRHFKH